MEDKKHGLADMQEGEFILNESGTSVSTDKVEGVDTPAENQDAPQKPNDSKSSTSSEEKDITV